VSQPKRLSQEEERSLARRIKAGDERAVAAWRLAAAAGLALVMAGGAWAAVTMHRLTVERGRLAARVSALADTLSLIRRPGTRVMQIPVSTNGRVGAVTIFVDSATQRWLVTCHGLSPNLPGEAYQMWFITEQGMKSAAVMPIEASHPMVFALEMPAGSARVLGAAMSIEPMPGSPEPKGPMVFQLNL
jgi:anti-sigma-K factor RskA/sigma-70-like protein